MIGKHVNIVTALLWLLACKEKPFASQKSDYSIISSRGRDRAGFWNTLKARWRNNKIIYLLGHLFKGVRLVTWPWLATFITGFMSEALHTLQCRVACTLGVLTPITPCTAKASLGTDLNAQDAVWRFPRHSGCGRVYQGHCFLASALSVPHLMMLRCNFALQDSKQPLGRPGARPGPL